MTTTSHLGITLVEQAQAQKEVTVNAAFHRIDALLNSGAKDKDLNTPPGSPATGDVYIVGPSPSGAWLGQAGKIAYFEQVWKFVTPLEGVLLWLNDENQHYVFDGTNWQPMFATKRMLYIPADRMRPDTNAPCAALATVTSTSQVDITSLNFDPATAEFAQFSVRMPKNWNEGGMTAVFEWSHLSATNFGVVWAIQAVAVSDGDFAATSFGSAQTVTDTGGSANILYKSPETASISISGTPAENDTVFFRIYRDANVGADTLNVDARLHGVVLFYFVNELHEAV